MKKEQLIEKLQKLPNGIEVCILDWRKNLNRDSGYGDGCGEGIYSDINIGVHTLEADEAEFYKEHNDKDFVPFASLNFNNDDYDDEGFIVI